MFLALAAACALVPVLRAGSAAAASGASLENVAVAPTGDAVAIWTENLGANSFVQAAARPPGGSWQAPVNLSAPGAGIAEVAIGPTGDAVAVWLRFNGTNGIVQAAARPAGGAWQPPIDLSAPDRNAAYPRVAVGSGGVAYAVWVSNHATDNEVVQAAARSAGGTWQPPVDLSTARPHL